MLPIDVFRNTTEERQRNRGLDIFMPVDRWGNRLDNTPADAVVSGQSTDFLFVVFSKTERGEFVFLLVDFIRLNDSRENRKSVLGI